MAEHLNQPFAVIEGRAPLPDQLITRQTYLPGVLAEEGVHTVFVDALNPDTYDDTGRIRRYTPYGTIAPIEGILEPGQYAWRVRDIITWPAHALEDSAHDPIAYPSGYGYNSAEARHELATRQGFSKILWQLGLEAYEMTTITDPQAERWHPGELVFVKPNIITDISRDPTKRAKLVAVDDLDKTLIEDAVLQRLVQPLSSIALLDQLGLEISMAQADYLHAIRIFNFADETPAIELRLTNPRRDNRGRSDIGKPFATELHLLEPQLVFGRLPQIADAHATIRQAFTSRFGKNNYLAFDYMLCSDSTVKFTNALVRALTPNLEGQRPEVQHLAKATADIEGRHLAQLAIEAVL